MELAEFSIERFRLLVDRCNDERCPESDVEALRVFLAMHCRKLLELAEVATTVDALDEWRRVEPMDRHGPRAL